MEQPNSTSVSAPVNLVLLPGTPQKPPTEKLDELDQNFLLSIQQLAPFAAEYERRRALAKDAIVRGIQPEAGPIKVYLKSKQRKAFMVKACTYFELVIE